MFFDEFFRKRRRFVDAFLAQHRRLAVANSARPITAARHRRLAVANSATTARRCGRLKKKAFLAAAVVLPAALVTISAIRSSSAVNAARGEGGVGAGPVSRQQRAETSCREPASSKQRDRTRALSASSRRLPQATGMTAARRRCVFLARQRASPLASCRSQCVSNKQKSQ